MNNLKQPIKLTETRAWRTYIGGALIEGAYGREKIDNNFPEEWIGSCVQAINQHREHIIEGLSHTFVNGDQVTLRSLVEKYPEQPLGKQHVEVFGTNLAILAKIIDSLERLTIQCHPSRINAKKFFNSDFGKAESWHIIGGREVNGEAPYVLLGFKEGVTQEQYRKDFDNQNVEGLIEALHKIYVKPGETYLIKGGVPHAIGPGCYLVELQEPTDYTFRVERTTPNGLKLSDKACHQGLGFDNMFECFDFKTYSKEEIKKEFLIKEEVLESSNQAVRTSLINSDYFSMESLKVTGDYAYQHKVSFSIIKVLEGKGVMTCSGAQENIKKGDEFFVPYHHDEMMFSGDFKCIIFYPPTNK